jgi:hypothetical protein
MYTILLIITLYIDKPFDVNYNYEGTLEDCIVTMKQNIELDTLYQNNNPSQSVYYFCIPSPVTLDTEL